MRVSEYEDIGQFLHDSRESLQVSLEQAAAQLHIRAKYLKSLETGKVDDLPGKAYIRGYIRNYAEYLRLDSHEVLEAYESLLAHKERDFFIPEPTLRQNLPSRSILKWACIGIVALYGYWYFDLHDRTALDFSIPDVPARFLQLLDTTPHAAMDKAWEGCLNAGDAACFMALGNQAIPVNKELYHVNLNNPPPQNP